MNLYVIRRRNAWKNPQELEAAASRSAHIGNEEMPDKVRWIRSYVVEEADGQLGTVCIYQGTSPEAIREHAERVGMPADEIVPIAETVVVREDPQPEAVTDPPVELRRPTRRGVPSPLTAAAQTAKNVAAAKAAAPLCGKPRRCIGICNPDSRHVI